MQHCTCTLQAFEQFGALYMHNHDDKYPARPGLEPDILWNALTSLCENKVIWHPLPHIHSVKRSDVTRWKQGYIRTPPPLLHRISQLGEN